MIVTCYNINKNPDDYIGITPLHLAAEYGHLEVCKWIVENVKDKNPKDDNGFTPIDKATDKSVIALIKSAISTMKVDEEFSKLSI